jgi:hypothetical protein
MGAIKLLAKARGAVVFASSVAMAAACGSASDKNADGVLADDWKCGTNSSLSGVCRCDTPVEKAGRIPTLDCNSRDYDCCTYKEGLDFKTCSCRTAAALADKGQADCDSFAEEFSERVVDTCPP